MQEIMASVLAALALGLLGSGHCMGMCGGIVSALSFAQVTKESRQKFWLLLSYNLGRISTYALLGGLAAGATNLAPSSGFPIARTLAGLLLILLGCHFLGLRSGLVILERFGQGVWRWLKPLAASLVPINHPHQAWLAGMVWGWLPCGLVYAALVYASAQPSGLAGAAVMLAFGCGTLPALLLGGVFATQLKQWLNFRGIRVALAFAYIMFGLWTLFFAWYHLVGHNHASMDSTGPSHHHHHH